MIARLGSKWLDRWLRGGGGGNRKIVSSRLKNQIIKTNHITSSVIVIQYLDVCKKYLRTLCLQHNFPLNICAKNCTTFKLGGISLSPCK